MYYYERSDVPYIRGQNGNYIKPHRLFVDGEREALSRRQGDHVDVPFQTEQLKRSLAARNGGHDVVRLKNGAPCGLPRVGILQAVDTKK